MSIEHKVLLYRYIQDRNNINSTTNKKCQHYVVFHNLSLYNMNSSSLCKRVLSMSVILTLEKSFWSILLQFWFTSEQLLIISNICNWLYWYYSNHNKENSMTWAPSKRISRIAFLEFTRHFILEAVSTLPKLEKFNQYI